MDDTAYIAWLREYETWYERATNRWNACLMICRGVSVVTAVLSAFLAALITPATLPTLKWIITVSSLGGAAATHLLAEYRVVKMEGLRAEGRAEAQHLVTYARDKLEEFANDPMARFKLKDEIRERLRSLEQRQGREFSRAHEGEPRGSLVTEAQPAVIP